MKLPQEGTPEYRLLECALLLLCETKERGGVAESLRSTQQLAITAKSWRIKDKASALLYAMSTENEALVRKTSVSVVKEMACLDDT